MHLSDQENQPSQTTSKLKKRRIQITENSPQQNIRTKSCDSDNQKSPKPVQEKSPKKRLISPPAKANTEKQSEKELDQKFEPENDHESKSEVLSKRPPSPMKTLSPKPKMKSRSPSPVINEAIHSPPPELKEKNKNKEANEEETDSKFNSILVSPNTQKESPTKQIEGGIVEMASPEIVNSKEVLSTKQTKIKSRNDNTTKSTVVHTSKNKKSKSKLGSNAAIS